MKPPLPCTAVGTPLHIAAPRPINPDRQGSARDIPAVTLCSVAVGRGCPASAWPLRSGQAEFLRVVGLPGRASEVSGDDVSGVPVEAAAGPVIAHRGARIGVRGGFLDVTQRNSGVEGGGD